MQAGLVEGQLHGLDQTGALRQLPPGDVDRHGRTARRPHRAAPTPRPGGTPPAITHAPIPMIRPLRSAKGTNSSGDTSPRSGCCQRISASTPITRLVVQGQDGLVAQGAARRRRPRAGGPRAAPAEHAATTRSFSSNSSMTLGPCRLALYIASSASRSSVSGVACSSADRDGDADADGDVELVDAGRDRRGDRCADPRGDHGGVVQVDESLAEHDELVAADPGDRVLGTTAEVSRAATARSTSSPTWWPWASLTTLNASTSQNSSAIRPRSWARRASACLIRSVSSVRFGRLVSASWCAECSRPPSARRSLGEVGDGQAGDDVAVDRQRRRSHEHRHRLGTAG